MELPNNLTKLIVVKTLVSYPKGLLPVTNKHKIDIHSTNNSFTYR